MQDQKKGDCLADWYFKDKAAKQALVERSILENPNEMPTTVIFVLMSKACGLLVPPKGK
jgi:hypothetical protein